MMSEIRPPGAVQAPAIRLLGDDDLAACVELLRASFGTVARDFGLTEENAPTNAAFTTLANLRAHVGDGMGLFGLFDGHVLLGCVALKQAKANPQVQYVERLAVAPAHRHRGLGSQLLAFALEEAARRGAVTASIGLIDENEVLKSWYRAKGFVQRERRRVPHLPFTVCSMTKALP